MEDLQKGQSSRIGFFLRENAKGGWEPWLQVESALAIRAAHRSDLAFLFEREVQYPALGIKCDLCITPDANAAKPGRGAPIWVELKTQRSGVYAGAIKDMKTDISKFIAHSAAKTDVLVAAAVLTGGAAVQADLKDLQTTLKSNSHLQCFRWPAGGAKWDQIVPGSVAHPATDILFVMWKNSK
ncbi:MAG TPA: hypothetical protein VGB08_01755 [Allosphingosinicella sp.]